jgi:hypothetical protein
MDDYPFDDLAWPANPLAAETPARHSTPPIAGALDLAPQEAESGAWHDDFLILGSRLGAIYGGELALDERAPAYLVPYDPDFTVSISCPVDAARADSVRASCPILALPDDTKGIFEFALRENGELPLVRLSFKDGLLMADYELPFVAAGIPALRSAVSAVGWVARRLRPELTTAYLPAAS